MKTVLYTGLDAPISSDTNVIHTPLIQIVPKDVSEIALAFEKAKSATHIIITSKTATTLSSPHLKSLINKQFISVGAATTCSLQNLGITNILTASNECQEGIIELLETLALTNPFFFWPHSALSRPIISEYFKQKAYPFIEYVLYNTVFKAPAFALNFEQIDEIHFPSSSSVDAFFHFFGAPPKHAKLHTKGPVTSAYLEMRRAKTYTIIS